MCQCLLGQYFAGGLPSLWPGVCFQLFSKGEAQLPVRGSKPRRVRLCIILLLGHVAQLDSEIDRYITNFNRFCFYFSVGVSCV